MDYIVTALMYVLFKPWICVPLFLVGIYYASVHLDLKDKDLQYSIQGLLFFLLIAYIVGIPKWLISPIVYHFGKPAIGTVIDTDSTIFMDAGYNSIYSHRAEYINDEGEVKRIKYRSNTMGYYPRFGLELYSNPSSKGEKFLLKYLPLAPSVFVFVSELEPDDPMCDELLARQAPLLAQEEELRVKMAEIRKQRRAELKAELSESAYRDLSYELLSKRTPEEQALFDKRNELDQEASQYRRLRQKMCSSD